MFRRRRLAMPLSAMLLAGLPGPAASAAQEPQGCEARGVYRPYNVARQFRLVTSHFADPSLPQRTEVLQAYELQGFFAFQHPAAGVVTVKPGKKERRGGSGPEQGNTASTEKGSRHRSAGA